MPSLRTALVGCGKVGHIHARALAILSESEFVAVCDLDPARALNFAQTYNVSAYSNFQTLLAESKPQTIVICTPHPLHAAPAIQAAQRGVHILVEKPLAANLADCDAMIDAARRHDVKLGVISQRRWYEPVRRMKEAIDAGKIGKPVLGTFVMYSWRDPSYYLSDHWRGQWDTEGGGVLVNQSPHMLDLLQWFMNDQVSEVSGYWANLNHPSVEVEDSAVSILRFRNGGLGSIVSSLSQKPGIHTKVHIHGSNGASVGVETDRGATFIAGMSTIQEPPLNDLWTIPGEEDQLASFQLSDITFFETVNSIDHYHSLQIEDFLRCVIQERQPRVTGEDGRRVVELFQAIYQSNREGRSVKLPASSSLKLL